MMNVRLVLCVDQTTVQILLDFILNLIAVMHQLLEMNIFVHLEFLVEKMKEIVILMMSVKMVLYVDQAIVLHHLVLDQVLIVAVVVICTHLVVPGQVQVTALLVAM